MQERALGHCKQEQKDYYECVKGRLVSVAWACRGQAAGMTPDPQPLSPNLLP